MLSLTVILVVIGSFNALALINPNVTPVHLVNQSSVILELQFGPVKGDKATATVKQVLKGKHAQKTVVFVLSTSAFAEHSKTVKKLVNSQGGATALFFAGKRADDEDDPGTAFGPDEEADGGGQDNQKAFLHIAGTWVSFSMGKNDWEMSQVSQTMGTTWSGGTDMLIRATVYILEDPDADVPVKEGVRWSSFNQFAKLDGPVHAATPVDLAGDGKPALYIARKGGDRLFRYDAKTQKLADVTAAAKLAARSRAAAWGDFNADGKMDLLSWDGEGLVLHTQSADGTFRAGEKRLKGALTKGCLALTCMDCGKAGHPGVVISTKSSPLLWTPDEPGNAKQIGGAFAGADLGSAGTCLVADFDGDAIPDILQLFEKGSLVYKGKAPGRFENAGRCGVALGSGTTSAFLGDYDADGLLDIFVAASDAATRLWNNRGKVTLVDTMDMTGELSYKGGSGAIGGMTGDFNNDGRQDVFFYYASTSPRLYFNRGFRNFGLTNGMDLSANRLLPQAENGQQAGCLADLNGDGAQDMVLVLKNGEAWAFYVEAGEGLARCVRAVLSSKGARIGPLTVTGWRGKRCLGAWNVLAGTSDAFLGQEKAGPMILKWQMPGGKPQQRKVVVKNSPVRVVLAP